MATIKFEGVTKIQKALLENADMSDVKKIVRKNGAELQRKAQANADFRGHYAWEKGRGMVFKSPTGTLKQSIKYEPEDGGLTAVVEPHVDYAAYVELGTRFMDAQPYLKPAWDVQKQKFKSDLDKLVR